MSRYSLFSAMVNRKVITLNGNVTGYIMGIELEDGSGYKFNVQIHTFGVVKTIFVNTVD